MARYIFDMPDNMAVMVEAFRVKRGHKSTAQAVRELIWTGFEVAGAIIGPITVAQTEGTPLAKELAAGFFSTKNPLVAEAGDGAQKREKTLASGKLDTATERVTFGPVDALTGEPLKPRRPMQKGKTK